MNTPQQTQERESQYRREVETAERSKALAENPQLNRILDELERAYIDKWRNDTQITAAAREALWNALQGAVQFRQHLRAQISSGEVARSAIEKMTRTAKPS